MPESLNERIHRVFRERTGLLSAMQESVRDAAKQYAAAGELMAISRDSRVVWVDPVTFREVKTEPAAAAPAGNE